MPRLNEQATCRAPAEEVWKLLYDPARFPQWWAGLDRAEASADGVTRYMEEWPDFAYPTQVLARHEQGSVTNSCLLSDIRHEWTLSPAPEGCLVQVTVEVPEAEAERLEHLRLELSASLPRLVAAAELASRA
jgi:hypothetical protein